MNATPNSNGNGNGKRRAILLALAAIFLIGGLIWFLLYWFTFRWREVTDDAYVNGNQVTLSSQVTGTVVAVLTDDTQRVEAGQTLVKLDPTDAELALAKAQSALAQAVRQVRQQTQTAAQYESSIAPKREELQRAEADLARREPLLAEHAIAAEEIAHARQAVADARSALDVAQRQSNAAHALIDGSNVAGNPLVQQARTAYREAWIAAHRNAIVAPVSGYVAQRSVQVGSRVQPGQPLLTILPLHDVWVDANFKEVQLKHLRIGQPAEVRSDVYGGDMVYHARVQGLAAGTGGAFALLPAQNASGNWIKVVQRVPVRIAFDSKELEKYPLRVGLSTEVKVDTHDRNGAVLAQAVANKAVAQTDVYTSDTVAADSAADAIVQANLGH